MLRFFGNTMIAAAMVAVGAVNATDYFSGEIRTREPFRYGKFKTRLQGSGQKGTVTSLFTFWNGQANLPWSVAEWEEIDIELVPSKQDNPFFTNIIYRNRAMDGEYYQNFDPATNWHEYEIVWKPSYIAWSIDGTEVRRRTNTDSVRDMDKWSLLYMNFWTPMWADWGGGRDDRSMPWYARYDYIEAYDWDSSTDTFNLRFRDDFDTLDQNIWRVSENWSFNDNSSLFVEEHTYVQDGNLILKMDKVKGDMMPNPAPPSPNPDPSPSPSPNPPQPEPEPCPTDGSVSLDHTARRYGNMCTEKHDLSDCSSCLTECHQSWPAIDPNGWMSPQAHCRCLPAQGAPESYTYGRVSRDSDAGLCGDSCSECRWSWPTDDPLRWKSDHLMARCMPSGVTPYDPQNDQDSGNNDNNNQQEDTYANWQPDSRYIGSGSCENLYDQDCGDNCTECNWTWPVNDPAQWDSNDARCRCRAKHTFIWGDRCASATQDLCGDFCQDCRMATPLNSSSGLQPTCRCKAW